MNIREIKENDRKIAALSRKLERLKADALNVTPTLTGMPGSGQMSDKIGSCIAEIDDTEQELKRLIAIRDKSLRRLSKDIDEENCIYLFLVRRYSWRRIAQITDGRLDTVASIKKRCYKYEW